MTLLFLKDAAVDPMVKLIHVGRNVPHIVLKLLVTAFSYFIKPSGLQMLCFQSSDTDIS